MRSILTVPPIVVVAVGCLVATPVGAQVIKETVPGITNYAHVESTVACAGAITTGGGPRDQAVGLQIDHQFAPGERAGRKHRGGNRRRQSRRHHVHSYSVQRDEPRPKRRGRVPEGDEDARAEPAFIH